MTNNGTRSKNIPFKFEQSVKSYGNSSFIVCPVLRNSETQEIVFQSQVCFVVVDKQTRKPKQICDKLSKLLKEQGAQYEPSKQIVRLKAPSDVFQYKTVVTLEEIDGNGHMNSADYVKLCINCASTAVRKNYYKFFKGDITRYNAKTVKKFHASECREDDSIKILTWQEKIRPEILYFMMYKDDTSTLVCEVTVEFFPKSLSLSKL